jgi:hypothetical protein
MGKIEKELFIAFPTDVLGVVLKNSLQYEVQLYISRAFSVWHELSAPDSI